MIYDTTVVKVTVTDIADKGDGTITAKVNYPDGGRTFTNRRTEKTQVHVRKVWRNATARTQPASVTIRLVADGKDTGRSLKLSEDNGWSGSFDGLQVKTDGKAITYTVTEDTVSGYSTSIEKDGDDYSFVVTNTRHSGGGGGGGGGGRRTPGTTAHQTTAPETQPGETVGSTESGVLPKTGMAVRIWAPLTGGTIGCSVTRCSLSAARSKTGAGSGRGDHRNSCREPGGSLTRLYRKTMHHKGNAILRGGISSLFGVR